MRELERAAAAAMTLRNHLLLRQPLYGFDYSVIDPVRNEIQDAQCSRDISVLVVLDFNDLRCFQISLIQGKHNRLHFHSLPD